MSTFLGIPASLPVWEFCHIVYAPLPFMKGSSFPYLPNHQIVVVKLGGTVFIVESIYGVNHRGLAIMRFDKLNESHKTILKLYS